MHVRLLHLHVMQAHDRIQFNHMFVRLLADHLTMDLAAGGHIDDHVRFDPCRTRQPPAGGLSGARRE